MSESSDQHTSTTKDDVPPYAEADVARQKASSSHCYSIAAISMPPGRDGALEEFPREKLTFKDKLGKGQFGEVSAEVELHGRLALPKYLGFTPVTKPWFAPITGFSF